MLNHRQPNLGVSLSVESLTIVIHTNHYRKDLTDELTPSLGCLWLNIKFIKRNTKPRPAFKIGQRRNWSLIVNIGGQNRSKKELAKSHDPFPYKGI